jgi:chromate reductase
MTRPRTTLFRSGGSGKAGASAPVVRSVSDHPIRLLLVSGSMRSGSSNAAVLRTIRAIAPDGVEAELFERLATLPHFNPDDDHDPLDPAVVEMRAAIAAADAVIFSTPEYAGALPGSFKNLLDWTIGGGEIYGKPVAWINASGGNAPTGGMDAHDSLRTVLGYAGGEIVEHACLRVPIARNLVGEDGVIEDEGVRARLGVAISAIRAHLSSASG